MNEKLGLVLYEIHNSLLFFLILKHKKAVNLPTAQRSEICHSQGWIDF